MKRQWYYRGRLKSCNYSCSYCPFSKRKGNEREKQADKKALFRFIEEINRQKDAGGAVQIVPYGEALIYPYYWEGLAGLSKNPRLDAIGAQSNFSFSVEQMLSVYCSQGGILEKLRLWGTFHPEMTTMEQFVHQCNLLSGQDVSYCVGAVGDPGQLEVIRRLRQALPDSVYLWINKMDGLERNYTSSEIEAFLEIDEYFEMELIHHRADVTLCASNRFVEADGTMHRCNICRESLGNFYEDTERSMVQFPQNTGDVVCCNRKECSCYLSYCNRKEEQLLFFHPYPAFRIPVYPKAAFFDVDGTLVPEGQKQIPEKYARWLIRLSDHCDIYLVTSLPVKDARRKLDPVWDVLCGGVFANGGRRIIWKQCQKEKDWQDKRERLLDETEQIETGWLEQAQKQRKRYGFTLHTYWDGKHVYKVTLTFRKGRLIEKKREEFLKELAVSLGIPESCQLIWEDHCIQVIQNGTGKLDGILNICRKMGYEKQEVAVFGNSENDIPMLDYFPLSVAARGSSGKVKQCAGISF